MAWKLAAALYCLLFLALALHLEAARPHRSMLHFDEESTLSKLRFETGDPASPSSKHTPTPSSQESAVLVEDALEVLPKDNPQLQDSSDCGPLGQHKYRCKPPMKTPIKTPTPQEVATVVQDAQVLTEDPSDCGPLGQHKYRCKPPMKTPSMTPTPEDVSLVGPSVQEAYQVAQSNCGPLIQHKYRCVPPMHS